MPRTLTLALIVVIALFIRTFNLSSIPPALFSDEIDAGYQAMVFNRFGSDYFGNKFPVHFHSFSDWRTPLYIYSVAIFQKIGFSPETSIRLPSVFYSLPCLLFLYLLTKSLIPPFMFSLSPWAVHYGRTGFEVSGMLFCQIASIVFLQNGLKNRSTIKLAVSQLLLISSIYFYSTAKLFVPFIILAEIYIYRQALRKFSNKSLFIVGLISLVFIVPLVRDTLLRRTGFRFSYISIITDPQVKNQVDYQRYQDIILSHQNQIGVSPTIFSKIIHNRYTKIIQTFLLNYTSSFSTQFLITTGDTNLRHGFGNRGYLYIIDLLLIATAIFTIYRSPSKLSLLFLISLIIAPIPFSLTRDSTSPHATRLILMLPSLIYLSYFGFAKLVSRYQILGPLIIIVYTTSFLLFWHDYQLHYPLVSARYWHYGIKEAVLAATQNNPSSIYFSNSAEPFLPFFLFYHRYLPASSKGNIASQLTSYRDSRFDGKQLESKYYFGNFTSNLTGFPPGSLLVLPRLEYYSNQNFASFKIVHQTPLKYPEQDQFFVLNPNET